MEEFNNDFLFKNKPDETTPLSAENLNVALKNTRAICADNAGSHNAIFRGKDVTNYFDDGSLWERISSGKFTDLFVGDYIVKNDITWRIAGFDIMFNRGYNDNLLKTKHHAVIVADKNLTNARINETRSTIGGTYSSEMYTSTLPDICINYVEPVFGEHVLEYDSALVSEVNDKGYNSWGNPSAQLGCSTNVAKKRLKINLMTENQVFGASILNSSWVDPGIDIIQLPLFNLAPEFISNGQDYWLRGINQTGYLVRVSSTGQGTYGGAQNTYGVRPYFYID